MRARGVTLVEVMVVVALIGIIGSLAVSTTEGLRARTAPRNAAADFSTALSLARSRATERGSDVWVIVYPNYEGRGAWFLYEDTDLNFGAPGALSCDGSAGSECNFATFSPSPTSTSDLIFPAPATSTSTDRLLDREYLDRYAKKNVQFGNSNNTALQFGDPFTGLNAMSVAKDCSFCSGSPRRGAIVFDGDGAARFMDGSGINTFAPSAALSMQGVDASAKQVTLFAISGPTGYVGVFK